MKIEDLKIGMKVKASSNYYYYTSKRNNYIGEVMYINENGFQIKTLESNRKEDIGRIYYSLLPEYFEPLKEENGERVNKEKVEEYNIIEAFNLPIGTELKPIFKDGEESLSNVIVSKVNDNEKTLRFKIDNKICCCDEMFVTAKFIKVQQSITFHEALESRQKVRLSSEKYDFYFESNEEYLNKLIKRYNEGEYMLVDELLCILSYYYSTSTVKKILTEKCWLIEEH